MLGDNLCAPHGAATAFPLGEGGAVRTFENSAACGGSRLHRTNRGSAALISMRLLSSYQNNNLGWHEVPLAVEHPRRTEKPPGTPSGRRLRLEIAPSPVERLFPLFKGESHAGA